MNLPLPDPELATSFGRRAFLRRSGLAAFTAALTPLALGSIFSTQAEGALLADTDILNFALNLEYLEGEYYSYAVFGKGLEAMGVGVTGVGTLGGTIAPAGTAANGGVAFSSPIIKGYATEIAEDEIAHIKFLRSQLGSLAVAKPAIDLSSAFAAAAMTAGISSNYNPYASDAAYLLGGITLTDVA